VYFENELNHKVGKWMVYIARLLRNGWLNHLKIKKDL